MDAVKNWAFYFDRQPRWYREKPPWRGLEGGPKPATQERPCTCCPKGIQCLVSYAATRRQPAVTGWSCGMCMTFNREEASDGE